MILLSATQLRHAFGERALFTIPLLEIARGDRIGLVGANGAGKTTLLRILAGELAPDGGSVTRHCDTAFIRQLETGQEPADRNLLGRFGVIKQSSAPVCSGGESTRVKIARALSQNAHLLLADEHTANLDAQGCALLQKALLEAETLLLVSHDRALIDALCTSILELRDGR